MTEIFRAAILAAMLVAASGCGAVRPLPEQRLREMLAPQGAKWNSPLRLTARAGGVFEGEFHAGTRRLVFASRAPWSRGIWICLLQRCPFTGRALTCRARYLNCSIPASHATR